MTEALGASIGVNGEEAKAGFPQEDRTMRITFILALALTAALLGPQAFADGPLHGRISDYTGKALIRGEHDDDWSYASLNTLVLEGDTLWADEHATLELELPGGVFARFADQSKAEIAGISPDIEVRAWTGSFYVQRLSRSSRDAVLVTQACEVRSAPNAMVRIDVLPDGSTTVSARWGSALVQAHSGPAVRVAEGQRVFIDPGMLPSEPIYFDRTAEDEFDAWNRERARLLALGEGALKTTTAAPATSQPYGVHDLAPYGDWVYVDDRPYWRPTVTINYVPYREGYWSHVPQYGYTWVGNYPFSYITTHYGRWTHNSTYGWMWTYVDGWSPAWCATIQTGSYCVWTPLDIYNRPVQYGSAAVTIGGYPFSYGASSYCYANDLLNYGYAKPNPYNPSVLNQIIVNGDVNIWNTGPRARETVEVDYPKPIEGVRDYNPRRSIRGLTDGKGSTAARARAVSLETKTGTERFVRAGVRDRAVRTSLASTARKATVRQPAIRGDASRMVRAKIERVQRSRTAASSAHETVSRQAHDLQRSLRRPLDAGKDAPTQQTASNRPHFEREAISRSISANSAANLGTSVRSRTPRTSSTNLPQNGQRAQRSRTHAPSKAETTPQRTRVPENMHSVARGSTSPEFRRLSERYESRRASTDKEPPTNRVETTPARQLPSTTALDRTPSRQVNTPAPRRTQTPAAAHTPQRTFRSSGVQRSAPATRPTIRNTAPSSPQPTTSRQSPRIVSTSPRQAPARPSAVRSTPQPTPTRAQPARSIVRQQAPSSPAPSPSRAPIVRSDPSPQPKASSRSPRGFSRSSGSVSRGISNRSGGSASAGRGISNSSGSSRGFSRVRR